MTESAALGTSTSSSSTSSSLSSNGSTTSKTNDRAPLVRRVPPPRISTLPPPSSSSDGLYTSTSDADGPRSSASTASLSAFNKPLVDQGAIEILAQSGGAGPSCPHNQASVAMFASSSMASQHVLSVAAPAATTASTRPPVMTRTASGGARIAALASKFGSSAAQKVVAAKQHVQLSASAALASGRNGNSCAVNSSSDGSSSFKALAGGLRDKGTNLVVGAAAKVRNTGTKGKERLLSASDAAAAGSPVVSPRLSPNPQHSASFRNLGRRPSVSSVVILGVSIPANRAGEVFGAPLQVAADRTCLKQAGDLPEQYAVSQAALSRRREACKYLPAIAIRCLDYLNEYGKTEEGIYRIPGSSQQVANLRTIFDSGSDVELLTRLSTQDLEPSAVASVFKLWLREREPGFSLESCPC